MHEFSTLDGFVDITESMAEMIKYVANEPSVGLFYVQQHTQNAVPNVVRLRNKVIDKSHETTLHTEDSEDSILAMRSMKECGFPIADEMIRDIKKTLVVMSTKQPRRGLIQDRSPGFHIDQPSSWKPSNWGRQDSQKSGYFSSVFKSAKKKASDLKWPPIDSTELMETKDDNDGKLTFNLNQSSSSVASGASMSSEADELPLSSPVTDEAKEERDASSSYSSHSLTPEMGNYDEFKADREAKLEEWLEGHGNRASDSRER